MTIITLPTYQNIGSIPGLMVMISLSGVTLVRLPLNVNGKTRNVIMMEELNKRTGRTGRTGATTMTDSFLSTKMKQLKNIQATVESTTGETQEMWINKWYELIRSIAKEIESHS
jgi:superfamily II DNA/RNA helicase